MKIDIMELEDGIKAFDRLGPEAGIPPWPGDKRKEDDEKMGGNWKMEIASLKNGIKALDKQVVEAIAQRSGSCAGGMSTKVKIEASSDLKNYCVMTHSALSEEKVQEDNAEELDKQVAEATV